jgi:hypothetical protein
VLVKKKSDGKLGHAVYRKKTHTDRYLNAASHHHPLQKTSLVDTLVHRAYEISDADSLPTEKKHLLKALQQNGYRNDLVLKRTAREERRRRDCDKLIKQTEPDPKAYATIPFVSGTSEKIARVLKKHDVVTRFNCTKKIADALPGPKDKIPKDLYEGVYQVPCSCGKAYIGETCRSMKVRMKEHLRATSNKQFHLSAISEHKWSEPGHDILFHEAKIIAKESRYYPRLIREAIEIAKNPENINRDEGYHLHNAWKRVLRKRTNQRAATGRDHLYKCGQNPSPSSST